MKVLPFVVLGLCSLGCVVGCQSTSATTMTTVWQNPAPPKELQFHKIAAFVLNATPAERRAGEDELARQVRSGEGVPAYTIVPDDDLKNRDKIREILKANGVDGAIVLRLIDSDKTVTHIPASYMATENTYFEAGFTSTPLYRSGYTTTDIVIRAEVSLYSVNDGKLLWSGSSNTTDPQNMRDLVIQVAGATRQELQSRGFLR